MCYAIPGKVEAIDDKFVTVNYFGERKKALNELTGLAVGDYIYAQGGFVIEKISPQEAEDILATWRELFFELQDLDVRLSRVELEKQGMDKELGRILDKVTAEKSLSREEYLYLLDLDDNSSKQLFYKTANFLRQKYHGNACCVHGIIEISNYCGSNCAYCGIADSVTGLQRYRMTGQEIIETAVEAVEKYGFKALVLQSGEDRGYTAGELAGIIKEIKARTAVLVFISFGEMAKKDLQELYQAGARGLLMRFETSNPDLYRKIHPGGELNDRLQVIRDAAGIGYLIVTGGLVGLPGQTKEDILNDLYLARELNSEMLSFGPCIPHPQTPLAQLPLPQEDDILKVLALCRFIDPEKANVVVTTGLETISPDARRKGLLAGANSVMINVTPLEYRKLYSIYPNRAHENETIAKQIAEVVSLLKSIGRAPTDLGRF
ncbi:MAG: radical SAM protein [bacterium]|nr:radical SAM protein [bacterium]